MKKQKNLTNKQNTLNIISLPNEHGFIVLPELEKINEEDMSVQGFPLGDDLRRMKVVLSLIPEEVKTILDVGCNDGAITKIFSDLGKAVLGIDLVKSHVEYCRKTYPKIDFTCGEIENIAWKFDMIFLGEVIEHTINPLEFLKSCRERLNDNGIIIITTPNVVSIQKRIKSVLGMHPEPNPSSDFNHLHLFTRKSLKKICESAGFDVEVMTSTKYSYYYGFQAPCLFDSLSSRIIFRIRKK